MGRIRYERRAVACARPGCTDTVEVKVGAAYQPQYCSSKCANAANGARAERRARRRPVEAPEHEPAVYAMTPSDLQNFPVSLDSGSGGRFATLCNKILSGEIVFLGLRLSNVA